MPDDICPHCDGLGTAPGDGRTPCGFCDGPARCQFTNRRSADTYRGGVRYVPCRYHATVLLERRGELAAVCEFHAVQARSVGWEAQQ